MTRNDTSEGGVALETLRLGALRRNKTASSLLASFDSHEVTLSTLHVVTDFLVIEDLLVLLIPQMVCPQAASVGDPQKLAAIVASWVLEAVNTQPLIDHPCEVMSRLSGMYSANIATLSTLCRIAMLQHQTTPYDREYIETIESVAHFPHRSRLFRRAGPQAELAARELRSGSDALEAWKPSVNDGSTASMVRAVIHELRTGPDADATDDEEEQQAGDFQHHLVFVDGASFPVSTAERENAGLHILLCRLDCWKLACGGQTKKIIALTHRTLTQVSSMRSAMAAETAAEPADDDAALKVKRNLAIHYGQQLQAAFALDAAAHIINGTPANALLLGIDLMYSNNVLPLVQTARVLLP